MKPNSIKTIITCGMITVGFVAIFFLSNRLENVRPPLPEGYEDQDLALQGAKLRGFSLGLEGLIADWYWMQSLQYIGEKVLKSKEDLNLENLTSLNPRLLYPLLDNATDLDPQFKAVYSYGAIVLPAIDPQQAIKIAEKGIANNPNEWRFHQHLGYIYWRLKNYEKAAEVYEEGARIPGSPPFMKIMAAQMRNEGGSRETARAIYEQMLKEAEDAQTRENAAAHLLRLDSLDERDALRPALEDFQKKNNRCAANWREIFPQLRALKTKRGAPLRFDAATFAPVDPSGAAYLLGQTDGKCDVLINVGASKIARD